MVSVYVTVRSGYPPWRKNSASPILCKYDPFSGSEYVWQSLLLALTKAKPHSQTHECQPTFNLSIPDWTGAEFRKFHHFEIMHPVAIQSFIVCVNLRLLV